MIFLYNSSVKIQIPIRPSPAPGDHDFNNFESTIPKNAHKVKLSWTIAFLRF